MGRRQAVDDLRPLQSDVELDPALDTMMEEMRNQMLQMQQEIYQLRAAAAAAEAAGAAAAAAEAAAAQQRQQQQQQQLTLLDRRRCIKVRVPLTSLRNSPRLGSSTATMGRQRNRQNGSSLS